MSLIFRFAIATGRASSDPVRDLSEALKPRHKKHHAAITDPKEAAKLLIAIDGFEGTIVVKTALSLSALLFQRPCEICHMEWQETIGSTIDGSCRVQKWKWDSITSCRSPLRPGSYSLRSMGIPDGAGTSSPALEAPVGH